MYVFPLWNVLHRMDNSLSRIWSNKVSFFGTFFLVFLLTYLMFVAIGFVPEAPTEEEVETEEVIEVSETMATATSAESAVEIGVGTETDMVESNGELYDLELGMSEEPILPTMISIARLEKTVPVLNPTSRSIDDLDAALLEGVVRHPDSAHLAQEGNIFILGHSSYLPNVLNRNFQAFNGIQHLEWGDTIEIFSDERVFEYRVEKVYRARAQDVTVPIAGTGNMLTLATCNSFGSIDDRYIVEAKRIDSRAL